MVTLVVLGWMLPLLLLALVWQKRLLAPAPFFAGFWLLATVAPVLMVPDAYVTPAGVAYIAAGVSFWVLGCLVASLSRPSRGDTPLRRDLGTRGVTRLVKAGTVAGLAAAAVALVRNGFDLNQVLSVEGLFQAGNTISVRRYTGLGTAGALTSALLAVAYAASLASPFLLMDRSGARRRLLVVAPFLSVVAYSVLTTERLGLLLSGALMAGGYLGMRVVRDGRVPSVSLRSLLVGMGSAGAVASLFVAIAFVRVGSADAEVRQVVLSKVEVYAFGYLPAFSQWLHQYRDYDGATPLGLGTASVAGVEYITGQERDDTRAYTERVVISSRGSTTNVYTGFRSLLYDFGESGSALMLFLLGFALTRAHRSSVLGRPAAGAALGLGYAVILLSQTTLITTFTNVVVGAIIAVLVVHRSCGVTPHGGGMETTEGQPSYEAPLATTS